MTRAKRADRIGRRRVGPRGTETAKRREVESSREKLCSLIGAGEEKDWAQFRRRFALSRGIGEVAEGRGLWGIQP